MEKLWWGCPSKAIRLSLMVRKSELPTTSDLKPYLSHFESSHHRTARNNQIYENQSIRGDYRMKSGRIYLRVAASWVPTSSTIPTHDFYDSLTGNRTPIRHQLRSLIGCSHATAGNPSSSLIVIAIVWLVTRIATFSTICDWLIAKSQTRHRVAGGLLFQRTALGFGVKQVLQNWTDGSERMGVSHPLRIRLLDSNSHKVILTLIHWSAKN